MSKAWLARACFKHRRKFERLRLPAQHVATSIAAQRGKLQAMASPYLLPAHLSMLIRSLTFQLKALYHCLGLSEESLVVPLVFVACRMLLPIAHGADSDQARQCANCLWTFDVSRV